jgi:transcriptional regulator of heat shock response
MISERQSQILNTIVDEYINTATPVSSSVLFDTGFFDVSCPTIRNEMAELTNMGFLIQPHTSAGRVPTERGYRFFVDELLTGRSSFAPTAVGASAGKQETPKQSKLARGIGRAREVSEKSNDLVILVDGRDREVKYIGMKKVFENPEFRTHEAVVAMLGELERFESYAGEAFGQLKNDLEIFIGSENPFFENVEYSMMSSRIDDGFIALLGPMRMNYKINLELLL